jgi:DNA-directed RNA polymerase specialized sigma24 family protein
VLAQPPNESAPVAGCDPLLSPFLEADSPSRGDDVLRALLEDEAAPIIHGVLQRKKSTLDESEEITSAAREQLIRQLGALRNGERQTPIRDFRSYVAGVAYSAWADHLRAEHPQRSMLLNRLRYLLENRTARVGFVLWESADGRKWCGLSAWQQKSPVAPPPKLQFLLSDPTTAARQAFGDRYWQRNDLASLIAHLFEWLETPIELRDLVFVTAEILEIAGRTDSLEARIDAEQHDENSLASYPSAADELIWKEYLLWLWQQLAQLPPRQCAAFLLNSSVLRDFELLGVASIRSLAPRFAMDADQLATIWQSMPLDDLAIAAELNCTRQQVINLRRVARDTLSDAWREFSQRPPRVGNNGRRSASSST